MKKTREKFIGCLLGGSIGDALGYPIEFLKIYEIYDKFGENGIEDLKVNMFSGNAHFSDDTQMTLFTVEGILYYENKRKNGEDISITECIFYSYERWLHTQGYPISEEYEYLLQDVKSPLLEHKELFSQKAPGDSCINALIRAKNNKYGTVKKHINKSKGCGGVMRAAPAGMYFITSNKDAFKLGCKLAAITHGHPTGYLSAGAFASIISDLCALLPIEDAIKNTIKVLEDMEGSEETINALKKAVLLAKEGNPSPEKLSQLGEGWIGEEALSIAIYCALSYPEDFEKALRLSVNHSGDSDSTGSICGSIMGAKLGLEAIPKQWIDKLELSDLIKEMAEKLYYNVESKIYKIV
ncbi:MAG: ADP-ribosylglycohydrolase family protein [Bacillota bacterium]|nr:ADP-ribosylglycohydrolase family protein [Bacillota bacterium]